MMNLSRPVCFRPEGNDGYIFRVLPGGIFAEQPWEIQDLLAFLSQIPNCFQAERFGQSDKRTLRYYAKVNNEPWFIVSLSRDLKIGNIQLLRDHFLQDWRPTIHNGRMLRVCWFGTYLPGWIGDRKEISILSGLYKSLCQIFNSDNNSILYLCSLFGVTEKPPAIQKGLKSHSQLTEILRTTPGYFHLKFDQKFDSISLQETRAPIIVEANGVRLRLVAMSWLSPTVVSAFTQSSYTELDATFYAMKPYVLCVPQFIKMNCAYPAGLIIAPTESFNLYEMFYQALAEAVRVSGVPGNVGLCVLSDAGRALKTFCDRHNFRQVQCHRHLIEWFGANSILKTMFLKILRSKNYEEYEQNLNLANAVFLELSRLGEVSKEAAGKYLEFTAQEFGPDGSLHFTDKREMRLLEWAIWMRGVITTCSNHAESFHLVLKKCCKPNGRHLSILKCLKACIEAIIEKQNIWQSHFTRNLRGYQRSGDNPPDWAYIWEVARRFELTLPPVVDPTLSETDVFAFLLETGQRLLAGINYQSLPVHHISHSAWTGEDFPIPRRRQRDVPVPPPEELSVDCPDQDARVQVAKDIWASLKTGDQPNLEQWVFHWTQQAIESQHINAQTEPGRAYATAWAFVREKLNQYQ